MDNKNQCNISNYSKPVQKCLLKAIKFQQEMYELSSDWNYYEESEHEYLKKNIRYSLGGEADTEYSQEDLNDEKAKALAKLEKLVELIYKQILVASRTKKSLYVGTVFNVLCKTDENGRKDEKNESFGAIVPIFKVRRCMDGEKAETSVKNDSTGRKKIGKTALYSYCVYYIDSEGRTYRNWTDYVTNNKLPKCIMVLPMGGFYQAKPDADNTADKTYAWIEIGRSSIAQEVLAYCDTASTCVGVGALGVCVAALATPIVAPVLVAGAVGGILSGLYSSMRSGQQLVDRHKHQQSISLTDRTARTAWFSVVGGVAGGAASGGTFVLSKAVQAGATVGNAGRVAYNSITFGNIVINGMGIGNGIYGIFKNYQENKEFSVLEIGQLIAHVLFFGNAVMNFQTAKTVINNTQQRVLQDYESSLRSNRHRKAFKAIRRNTHGVNGDAMTADSEIIRAIKAIENKDDFFAGVVRNRKIFKDSDAKITFKDGYATINNNVKFDPVKFSQQPKDVRVNAVSAVEPLTTIESALPRPSKMLISDLIQQTSTVMKMLQHILATVGALKQGLRYIELLIFDMQGFTEEHRLELFKKLAEFARSVIQNTRSKVTNPLEEIMYCAWRSVVRSEVDNILQNIGINISGILKSSVVEEIVYDITLKVINKLLDATGGLLEKIIQTLSQRLAAVKSGKCSVCSGHVLKDS